MSIGLVVEYWPFVDACALHSHSKLYHCVILLFVLAFDTTHPTPVPLTPTPLYTLHGPVLMNFSHEKIVKN